MLWLHVTLEGALFCIATYLTALMENYIGRGALFDLNSFKVNFFRGLTLSAVSFLICYISLLYYECVNRTKFLSAILYGGVYLFLFDCAQLMELKELKPGGRIVGVCDQ